MIKATAPYHILSKPAGPACNLHCDYCFYLEKEKLFPGHAFNDFKMSDEMLENFTKQYIQSQPEGCREVNFAWQGGEPTLMGIDFYKRAVELQKKYAGDTITVNNAFQTNGILIDDDWARFFKDNNFLLGISVDGPEKMHDKFRKDRGGNGSFSRVMKGIESLKKSNVDFNTLTVVQSDNGAHPVEIYNFLKSIGSYYHQYIPIVERISEGKVSSRSVGSRQWGTFMNNLFDQWIQNDVGNVFVQMFDMILGIHMGSPASMCVHSPMCGRALAMEHTGDLYSCDHFVFPENLLGNIGTTDIADLVDGPKQTKFGKDKYDTLPGLCHRCNYEKFCYGACPANRNKKTPSGDKGLSWLCEGYKMFYQHSEVPFLAMAEALKRKYPASEYKKFMGNGKNDSPNISRNTPCPCGSGKKYKHCHGKK